MKLINRLRSILPQEFELWKGSLKHDELRAATGYLDIIKRRSESIFDASGFGSTVDVCHQVPESIHDLYSLPFSHEYRPFLTEAAELLNKAADLTDSPRFIFC